MFKIKQSINVLFHIEMATVGKKRVVYLSKYLKYEPNFKELEKKVKAYS